MPEEISRQKRSWIIAMTAVLIAGAAVTAVLFYPHDERVEPPVRPATDEAVPVIEGMTEKEVVDVQKAAALAAIPGKPVSGPVTKRPDFVSEIEWQVFQNVIKNQPDGGEELLTDLVNKLLFFKKREAWLSAEEGTVQRKDLARELLGMIPEQLKLNSISPSIATEMKTEIALDLK